MKWMFAIVLFGAARLAAAQVIYEPVQYEYGDQTKFYYGGSDPAFFELGAGRGERAWGRTSGFAFYSGTIDHFREVTHEPLRVYTDELPYENASICGYTVSNARDAAYANLPRYFIKRDLLAAGIRQWDGSRVVPAQAQPIPTLRPSPTTRPASQPIMIIPKGRPVPAPRSNNLIIVMK